MLAEEMNQAHRLDPRLQYDFYYYGVRKGKRFGFPKKPVDNPDLKVVSEYYGYSHTKAAQALQLLTKEQVDNLRKKLDKGGRV